MRLEEWLDTATYGLMPEARERIRREVHSHIAIAMADGASESKAVEQLGSPSWARMRYGLRYLSSEQIQEIQEQLSQEHSKSTARRILDNYMMLVCVWLACTMLNAVLHGIGSVINDPFSFTVIVLFSIQFESMSSLALQRRRIEISVMLSLASKGVIYVVSWILAREVAPTLAQPVLIIGGGIFTMFAVIEIQRARVLRKNVDVLDFLCAQPRPDTRDLSS